MFLGMCGLNGCNILLPQTGDTPRIHPPAYEIVEANRKVDIIIDIEKTPDLLNEGSAVKIIDKRLNERIIIANTGKNGFSALSIFCTHNGAEVEYKHDLKKLVTFKSCGTGQSRHRRELFYDLDPAPMKAGFPGGF